MREKEKRETHRRCECTKEIVNLTAEVNVLYQGTPAVEKKIYVLHWLDCDKKGICGRTCNYFYASYDCTACDEKNLMTFP